MKIRLAFAAAVSIAILGLSRPVLAEPAATPFDPREYQAEVAGERTRVLVLGSPHLSGAPDTFDPAVLEPLLERLAAFRPDVIAIENLSGESIYLARTYADIYPETANTYGGRAMVLAAMGWAGTGLDLPRAEAEVRQVLRTWPKAPTPQQRRRLAALFAASGDPHSALVQWWRLEPSERKAGDGVTRDLVAALNAYDTRRNESHLIGSRLAARLGLERVYPTDDHSADDAMAPRSEALGAFYSSDAMKGRIGSPALLPLIQAAQRTGTPEETLAMYRWINTPEAGRLDADGQWRFLLAETAPVARERMAEWEARNLRMVAHIREAAIDATGGRVLVIVGSAHKPWFDAYLSLMTDIEVVDAVEALR